MKKNLCLFLCALMLAFSSTTNGQIISTAAGNGTAGSTGDGGPATAATLFFPSGVTVAPSGNVYIGGLGSGVIRWINSIGDINTLAGTGTTGYGGDGGPATAALVGSPISVTSDAAGNIYFADQAFNVVRMINTAGIISTVAGTGGFGFSLDGGAATATTLASPSGVAVDAAGNIYISEQSNHKIRKVDPLGIISTVAGNGIGAYIADGIAATLTSLNSPYGITVDNAGNLYIADQSNNRVRMVDPLGIISTIAGTGVPGYTGDGSSALVATISGPLGVEKDEYGNVYIAEGGNNTIRKINTLGIISTLAGNGLSGYTGDGGAATAAQLSAPNGLALDNDGNIYVADGGNNALRFLLLNHAPIFTGGLAQSLSVCQESTSNTIDGLFATNDADAGQTETYTVITAPVNGTLGGFPATTTSTGATVTPSGLTYTPNSGYSGSDVFTVQVDDGNGGNANTTINVTVNATPTMNPVSSFSACNNATTSVVNFTSAGSGTTYSWTSSNTSIGLGGSGTGDLPSFTAINTGTTSVSTTVTVTPSANSCTGIPQLFTITVNPTPDVAQPANAVYCNGAATSAINFTGNVSGTTFDWTNDDASIGLASTGSGNIPSFTATNGGATPVIATVSVTPTANSCPGTTAIFTITVNPTPLISAPASQFVCNNTATTAVVFTGSVAGTVYNWNNSDPSIGLASTGSGDIASFTAINSTVNTVISNILVTPTANGCIGTTQSFDITVYPTPVLTTTPTSTTQCNNSTFFYVLSSATPGTSFSWSRAAVTGISNLPATGADTINEILNNTSAFTQTVTYVDTLTANGCVNTQNITVTVNPTPSLSSSLTPPAICDSTIFSYAPTSAVAGASFVWTRLYTLGIDKIAATGAGNPFEKLVNTTNGDVSVTYTYIITANGCTDTQDVVVKVHPTTRLTSTDSTALCSGVLFTYTPTSTVTGTTYAWTRTSNPVITPGTGSGTGNISETLTNSSPLPATVQYIYTLTANGCSNKAIVKLTVRPAPVTPIIDDNPPTSLCSNTMYQNFGTSIAPAVGVSYTWTATNAKVFAAGSTGQYAIVNFPTSGTAVVTLTASTAFGCSASASASVNVSSSVADAAPKVSYINSQFVCLQNVEDGYQWGYDEVLTLKSNVLTGEINQNYYNNNPGFGNRFYWVIVSHGGCKQKAYYNAPATVVESIQEVASLKVYPNPAHNTINVEISGNMQSAAQVEVYNMLGQMIRSVKATDNATSIDVQDLTSGMYLINCTRDGVKIATARFIKN